MPRNAHIVAHGYPHHITQRGNNRAPVFFDDEDRQTYLKLLAGYGIECGSDRMRVRLDILVLSGFLFGL
jgi:REP element-mobilizing transposase RayT